MRGTIKTLKPYEDGGGFGFVKCDDPQGEYYFKYRAEEGTSLTVNANVEFELVPDRRDPQKQSAVRVRALGGGAPRGPALQSSAISSEYFLPRDTAGLLCAASVEIENTALCTEKYIRVLRDENGAHIPKIKEESVFSKAEKALLSALHDAQALTLRGLACRYAQVGELKSRMAVGLGSSSVFETGMIFHKPYGFPYIPGSAVKGALRHLIIGEAFMGDENRAAGDADFAAVFGKQDHRGKLLFFDVYPSGIERLELDIMNPHFSDYYMSKKPPTDTYNPTPIVFRVVPAGTKFTFRIAGDMDRTVSGRPIRDWFSDLMRYAGFGAKTAVGYGWMTPLSAAEDTAPVASKSGTAIGDQLLQKAKKKAPDAHATPMPKRGFNEKTVKLVFNKIKNSVLNSEDRRVLTELANVRESDADYAKWEKHVRQARAWLERQNPSG